MSLNTDGRFQPSPDVWPVYVHSVISTGICTYDGQDVVVMRVLMGASKFELRFTSNTARTLAENLTHSADNVRP